MGAKKDNKLQEYSIIEKEKAPADRDEADSFVLGVYEQLKGEYRSKAGNYMLHLLHAQEMEQELIENFDSMLNEKSGKVPAKRCIFCCKGKEGVRKLICGPDDFCICNECIQICFDLISSHS